MISFIILNDSDLSEERDASGRRRKRSSRKCKQKETRKKRILFLYFFWRMWCLKIEERLNDFWLEMTLIYNWINYENIFLCVYISARRVWKNIFFSLFVWCAERLIFINDKFFNVLLIYWLNVDVFLREFILLQRFFWVKYELLIICLIKMQGRSQEGLDTPTHPPPPQTRAWLKIF